MADLKVLLLSRYDRLGASSRLRFYDYVPYLEQNGIHVTVAPFFDDRYLTEFYAGHRVGWKEIAGYYRRRFQTSRRIRDYDLVWLEKEALPWLPAWIELPCLRARPYAIDFDDAWFERYNHHRDPLVRTLLQGKFERLVEHAASTLAGSEYLAGWARANKASPVVRIPTTVNLKRYAVANTYPDRPFTIGWMGSPTSARYLASIAPALAELDEEDDTRVLLVGSGDIELPGVRPDLLPWSEPDELALLHQFDVGVMPLDGDRWSEGKCAYKLIQYMAAGLPVVASPVGMNREVVKPGENGFLAESRADWVEALQELKNDPSLRRRMGEAGRRLVEEHFSLEANAPRVAKALREAAGRKGSGKMAETKPMVILGAGGQVGKRLAAMAAAAGRPVRACTRDDVDITSEDSLRAALLDAAFVVNCAAYTAVDKAESEQDQAFAVNAEAPATIARLCRARGIPFLHISTDYVFGEPLGRPWKESDPVVPLNAYGVTKEAGEARIRQALPRHLILRTSWVYDSEGANFVRTMLRLGAERPELRVVGDQKGGPTSAEDIARVILAMAETAGKPGFVDWGTYHFSGAPPTTWFDFATAIFEGREGPRITRIASAEYPTPATRPPYSVLDCGKIHEVFGITQPDWRASLKRVMDEIEAARAA